MEHLFKSRAARLPGYRPDIDGLRALAILSVILYHAGYRRFEGGFVGVDVFFVISGFLITGIIEREIDQKKFSFFSFYDRRIRRIFPALFAMATVCSALAAVLFPPRRFLEYGKSLAAMAGFSSNFYFYRSTHAIGYFTPAANSELLLHTWSLAVEEQFYVLFPILLVVLAKARKSHRQVILTSCLILSLGWSAWAARHSPTSGFYLLPSRAWELLLGSLLALKGIPVVSSRVVREIIALTGLIMLGYSVFYFTEQTPFPGFYALVPCVGVWLILYAGEGRGSWVGRFLSLPPLVELGLISYSLYLWHWPVFTFGRYYYARRLLPASAVPPLLWITLVLSLLSFFLIETPFRRRRPSPGSQRQTTWIGLAASVAFAAIALSIVFSAGWPNRFNPEKGRVLAQNNARKYEYPRVDPTCNNYEAKIEQYADAKFCAIGHSKKNILFWGDSHVEQLYPLIERLQKENELDGRGAVFAMSGGCPPSTVLNRSTGSFHCDTFAHFAMMRAQREDIDTIFIQFLPWWTGLDGLVCVAKDSRCMNTLSGVEAGQTIIRELGNDIRLLRANNKRVILGLPFPYYSLEIPDYLIRKTTMRRFHRDVDIPYELTNMDFQTQLREEALRAGAEIYDPRLKLCPAGTCVYQTRDVSLYVDESHIATSQIDIVRDGVLKALKGGSP